MGWITWDVDGAGCSSTTGTLPRSLALRHLASLSLITASSWLLINFPMNSLLPGPAAATTWSWSVMQESMPVEWERDSAYSFAKRLSSPIGEYFFRMISPSRSVKISSGVPSLIRRVRRISFGMTTRPRSSILLTIPVAFIYLFLLYFMMQLWETIDFFKHTIELVCFVGFHIL